ncbi:MAG: hypothetical protein WCS52_03945 [bacterium]
MRKGKIRLFRVELATCLLVPLIVLLAVVICGYGYVTHEKKAVMRPAALLEEVPQLESRLSMAQKALSNFRMNNGGKENGEWSHRVSQAASVKGVAVKSINVEKIVPQIAVSCNDYRVQVCGEGRMAAVVGWLDELDQPARCFRVASLKMRPLKLGPSQVYELETVINARAIAMLSSPGEEWPGQIGPALEKLNTLILAVNQLAKTKWPELDTRTLDERERAAKEERPSSTPLAAFSLKLNGIAKDGHKSLALTDRGVFEEGDTLDGTRILKVATDHIVVVDGEGRQTIVRLYESE